MEQNFTKYFDFELLESFLIFEKLYVSISTSFRNWDAA